MNGYTESIPLNVYDAYDPRISRLTTTVRLFNSGDNIGNRRLTNLVSPGCLVAGDQGATIQNWYARSSLTLPSNQRVLGKSAAALWERWTNVTTATLVLGCMHIHSLSLSDLLKRREGQRDEIELPPSVLEELARTMFEHHDQESAATRPSPGRRWNEISGWEQATWRSTADLARLKLRAPVLAVVPCRQICSVEIATDMAALDELVGHLPADDSPRLWVHLEGFATRPA